jgi:hypothetical protein
MRSANDSDIVTMCSFLESVLLSIGHLIAIHDIKSVIGLPCSLGAFLGTIGIVSHSSG